MNAAAGNGPEGESRQAERERLFTEIALLKEQRNRLQAELAECRRALAECRARLEGLS